MEIRLVDGAAGGMVTNRLGTRQFNGNSRGGNNRGRPKFKKSFRFKSILNIVCFIL